MRILHWLLRRSLVFLFWGLTWGLAALVVVPAVVQRRIRQLDPEVNMKSQFSIISDDDGIAVIVGENATAMSHFSRWHWSISEAGLELMHIEELGRPWVACLTVPLTSTREEIVAELRRVNVPETVIDGLVDMTDLP